MTFQIDPRSTLTMHRGGPPLDGFGAFPSEFSPKFLVALDGSGPDQLSFAVRVVAAIARVSKIELTPEVVDLEAAANATSGALIVANSKSINQTSLKPPVGGDGSTVNLALPTELQVNIDNGLGSIQAFADPPRNRSVVLVTTTKDWKLVDPLFGYIEGSAGTDWSQMTGDVLAAGAAGTPTQVAIRTADSIIKPPESASLVSWLKTPYVVVGIGVLAAVAALTVLAVILFLRRRRTRLAQNLVGTRSPVDPDL